MGILAGLRLVEVSAFVAAPSAGLAMAQMDIVCGLDSLMCRMSLLNPTIHCELNAMK